MFGSDTKNIYRAALVVIGNEILTGRTPDANTPWIAEKLLGYGIVVVEVRIVPDIAEKIIKAVNELRPMVDYVFTTGGIGPTHDDITAECIAGAFGVSLVRHPDAFDALCKHYATQELSGPREKMAFVPEGARLIPNPVSAAPGFIIENVYVMAGVPRIMQAMLDYVVQTLAQGDAVLSNTVSCNLPESVVAEDLAALQAASSDVEIGSYPHFRGGVPGLSLVVRGIDSEKIAAATKAIVKIIRQRGGAAKAMGLQVDIADLL